MSDNNNAGKLYARIAKVSSDVGSLVPDKRNKDQNYDYISADKILERAGRAMAEAGLVVAPSITAESCEMIEYESYGKKKSRYDAVLEFDMLIADADGNSITQHWISRGTDYVTPDKALYKAITSGHKYFLMKLFNVGVGNEDGEHEEPPQIDAAEMRKRPRKRIAAPAPAAPAPPGWDDIKSASEPTGGNGADPLQAARASLKGRTSTLADIATAAVMSGLYDNTPHAFNAVKLYDWPASDKFQLVAEQKVKSTTARTVLDWLISRKLDEVDAGADTAEAKEVAS